MSDVASLASDMSAYTDRSTVAGSTRTSGSSASTIGGRGAKPRKRTRRSGKIRQGTHDEEQQLSLLVCDLAPSAALCTQVRYLYFVSSAPCLLLAVRTGSCII